MVGERLGSGRKSSGRFRTAAARFAKLDDIAHGEGNNDLAGLAIEH
jgi:hypothetical protein